MSSTNDLPYETRILNLLTNEQYSLAEVIARHSRASGVSLDEADKHIKQLINNPISNLRVADIDDLEELDDDADVDSERAAVASQTLLATTAMLNSNIPTFPMQERLRRLAHAAVEDLELYYFGVEDAADEAESHGHHHGHDH